MIYIDDIAEIDKIIRNELILQSEIDGNLVRNAQSLYGVDLAEVFCTFNFGAVEQDEILIIFHNEFQAAGMATDISETNTDSGDTTIYKQFNCHLIIYGDDSDTVVSLITSRFMSPTVRNKLYAKGIYINKATHGIAAEEFINGQFWSRHDCDISFGCQLLIPPIDADNRVEAINGLNIIELKDEIEI